MLIACSSSKALASMVCVNQTKTHPKIRNPTESDLFEAHSSRSWFVRNQPPVRFFVVDFVTRIGLLFGRSFNWLDSLCIFGNLGRKYLAS